MTTRDFCFWLQGFLEVSEPINIKPEQIKIIKEHLGYVFEEIGKQNKPSVLQSELTGIPADLAESLRRSTSGTGVAIC